ncbi:unnamed protein product [Medioppia subpectinata]|uniref:Protein kinase domain-containing protein n=1 Tax=Medioppia subpectinata TaxID=1979941 RepID=A0A7R9KLQ2_9ACAR|nr:unnamed protein product [Medioppia subpectinata]CAG2105916.1 unnamed protein product [Medioppia subpectinata]
MAGTKAKIESIYCCYDSSFAITSDRQVFSWGDNRGHELEHNKPDNRLFKPQLISTITDVNISNNEFTELSIAGSGTFGTVFKVRHTLDDNIYAVKKVQFEDNKEEKEMMIEVEHLKNLDSDFVVKYENSWTEGKQLYIQMEYCSQTLASVLRDKQQVFGRQSAEAMNIYEYFICCEIFRELLECVRYLHEQSPPFIHRDLKPDNIFIIYSRHKNTFVKLGDFGLATVHSRTSKCHTRGAGTPKYMAPEVHSGNTYDTKADLYSVGGIGMTLFDIYNDDCHPNNSSAFYTQFNHLQDFLMSLTENIVDKRPTSGQVLDAHNQWSIAKTMITSNKQEFNEMLNKLKYNENTFFYECLLFKTESMDSVAESLAADTMRCDLALDDIGEHVAAQEVWVQQLNPMTTTVNTDDIGVEVTQVKLQMAVWVDDMRTDVQTLRKGGYSTATIEELNDRVQHVSQRMESIKDQFGTQVLVPLVAKLTEAQRRSPGARQTLMDKYPTIDQLQECIRVVDEMDDRISALGYQDLVSLRIAADKCRAEKRAIDDFGRTVDRCGQKLYELTDIVDPVYVNAYKDVVIKMFSYLTIDELIGLERVSKEFQFCANYWFQKQKTISFNEKWCGIYHPIDAITNCYTFPKQYLETNSDGKPCLIQNKQRIIWLSKKLPNIEYLGIGHFDTDYKTLYDILVAFQSIKCLEMCGLCDFTAQEYTQLGQLLSGRVTKFMANCCDTYSPKFRNKPYRNYSMYCQKV